MTKLRLDRKDWGYAKNTFHNSLTLEEGSRDVNMTSFIPTAYIYFQNISSGGKKMN